MTALKTLIWSVFAPGIAVVLVPYLLLTSRVQLVAVKLSSFRYVGIVPILLGACFYLWCAWDFTFVGKGTPAPFDPPKKIVVTGLYRFVRNPIYVAVILVVVGEAILFESIVLLIYALILFLGFDLWVRYYEEPSLRRRFGESYEGYCRKASRWIPRA
jgi:protein-S-isoprenylcysteine O-methyltransferase Ste14